MGRYLNKTGPGGLDQAVKPPADIILHSECLCRFVCGHGNLAYLAIILELQSRDWLYHDSKVTKFIQDHQCCPLCNCKSAVLSYYSDSPLRSQQSKQKHLCNRLNVSCSQLGGAGLAGAALSALGCRLPQPPLFSHHHVSHLPRVRVGGAGEPAPRPLLALGRRPPPGLSLNRNKMENQEKSKLPSLTAGQAAAELPKLVEAAKLAWDDYLSCAMLVKKKKKKKRGFLSYSGDFIDYSSSSDEERQLEPVNNYSDTEDPPEVSLRCKECRDDGCCLCGLDYAWESLEFNEATGWDFTLHNKCGAKFPVNKSYHQLAIEQDYEWEKVNGFADSVGLDPQAEPEEFFNQGYNDGYLEGQTNGMYEAISKIGELVGVENCLQYFPKDDDGNYPLENLHLVKREPQESELAEQEQQEPDEYQDEQPDPAEDEIYKELEPPVEAEHDDQAAEFPVNPEYEQLYEDYNAIYNSDVDNVDAYYSDYSDYSDAEDPSDNQSVGYRFFSDLSHAEIYQLYDEDDNVYC